MSRPNSRIVAVLGPTNTGKTRYAIERMLCHSSGMIGLPLRLLAREVFDKVLARRGPSTVALVTGEERIIPHNARYWVCTTEAMPVGNGADFVAIDEIQLCADPERGYIFTDRLLRARGQKETLLLGAETMRKAISYLVPEAQIEYKERLSTLTYSGHRKLKQMQPRTAIVGFSVEDVYSIADSVRRQRGGAAVVMGALSPRTRNAQVSLYQNGEVDFLVATDAIGMGLNLDISHVAFGGISKFDGRRVRFLAPNELAQIAGRAGRYKNPGTFGTTADCSTIRPFAVKSIETSSFKSVHRLLWRNPRHDYRTIPTLMESLAVKSGDPMLVLSREASDILALRNLSRLPDIQDRVNSPREVKLLWEICQTPDFRNISEEEHAELVRTVFEFIQEFGYIPHDWLEKQVSVVDRIHGEIEQIAANIAFIRTWTYLAQRSNWVEDTKFWRERTRDVEDRLSDALHERLIKRFVDRRTSTLVRRLKGKETLVADLSEDGLLEIEGEPLGRFEGFRFIRSTGSTPEEDRALKAVCSRVVGQEYLHRARQLSKASDKELEISDQGELIWGEQAVGRLVAGHDLYSPGLTVLVDEEADSEVKLLVERRLAAYIEHSISSLLEPLLKLKRDEALEGDVRGFAYRLVDAFGILRRLDVTREVKALDQESRAKLRSHGIRFGQHTIFQYSAIRPKPTRLRMVLWSLQSGFKEFPPSPPPGLTTLCKDESVPSGYYPMCGFIDTGPRAVRVDILDRLMVLLREQNSREGFEATADMLSITGLSHEGFAEVMQGLGFKATKKERSKRSKQDQGSEASDKQVRGTESGGEAKESSNAPNDESVKSLVTDSASRPQVERDGVQIDSPSAKDESLVVAQDSLDEQPADETEVFFIYTWEPRKRRPASKGVPKGRKQQGFSRRPPRNKSRNRKDFDSKNSQKGREFSKRKGRKKDDLKKVDPDSPFAVLLSIRDEL